MSNSIHLTHTPPLHLPNTQCLTKHCCRIIIFSITGVLLTACASKALITPITTPQHPTAKFLENSKPILFSKINIKLKKGEHIGALHTGMFCLPKENLTWKGGKFTLDAEDFTEAFHAEVAEAGYKVAKDANALFGDSSTSKPEILIAANIQTLKANVCYDSTFLSSSNTSKGEAYVKIEWHAYSKLDKTVVYSNTTEGTGSVERSFVGGDAMSVVEAFSQAAQQLLADEKFQTMIAVAGKSVKNSDIKAGEPLTLNPDPLKKIGSNPAEWGNAVATVLNGSGHGSGFLISGNLMLSNKHVVNALDTVQVKFTNGIQLSGKVIHADLDRDVALIQLDASFPKYFHVSKRTPVIGQDVYAIGSPINEIYSASISKGVISGMRQKDGKSLIQSDVNIRPGNSGGPLVDDEGNLVGIAVSGLVIKNIPQGINFFIPIADALNTLNIQSNPSLTNGLSNEPEPDALNPNALKPR